MPKQAQQHLQRQGHHREQEELHNGELQQAHALEIFAHETPEQRVDDKAAEQVVAADDDHAEDGFGKIAGDAKNVWQIAVHLVNETIVVPGLPRPEPLPARPANESPDDNHGNPQDDEAEKKSADGKLALLPGVIAAT